MSLLGEEHCGSFHYCYTLFFSVFHYSYTVDSYPVVFSPLLAASHPVLHEAQTVLSVAISTASH